MAIDAKRIAMLGMGIALYVVVGLVAKIPLIGHIQIDLGYIVFGVFCVLFGWQGCIVGVFGALLNSLLFSGWLPIGWIAGQLVIGVMCGICYTKSKSKVIKVLVTILAVFIGIAVVKTGIECALYQIPLEVKFVKDFVAFVADTIPMLIGVSIGEYLKSHNAHM